MAICLEELKDEVLYKRPFLLPFSDKDKKKGSAVYLLSASEEASNGLMNNPLTINKRNFESYYTERNLSYVLTGVEESGNMVLDDTRVEDFDNLKAYMLRTDKMMYTVHRDEYYPTIEEAIKAKGNNGTDRDFWVQTYDIKSGNLMPINLGQIHVLDFSNYHYMWKKKEEIVYDPNGCIKPLVLDRDDELEDCIFSSEPIEATLNGAYDSEGLWNSLIVIGDRNYRERCEALIFYNNSVFIYNTKDGHGYRIPGGGTETTCSIEEQMRNECKEEARIILKNVKYVKTYMKKFGKKFENKPQLPFEYHGSINHLYIAEYNGNYSGYIRNVDRDDSMYAFGNFYPIEEVYDRLNSYHKAAVDIYLATRELNFTEAKLNMKDRNELSDEEFGIPKLRKFPLNDEAHVRAAIRFYGHCEDKHKKELATNIRKAIKKFNMNVKF